MQQSNIAKTTPKKEHDISGHIYCPMNILINCRRIISLKSFSFLSFFFLLILLERYEIFPLILLSSLCTRFYIPNLRLVLLAWGLCTPQNPEDSSAAMSAAAQPYLPQWSRLCIPLTRGATLSLAAKNHSSKLASISTLLITLPS